MPPSSDTSKRSSQFSELTKNEVRRLGSNQCWVCTTSVTVEVAHIVGKQDTQIQFWADKGLLLHSLTTPLNAIALCANCHAGYDNAEDPAFLIVPSDIDFFIEYELRDRDNRNSDGHGKRSIPTLEDYCEHMRREGAIDQELYGLFQAVFIRQGLVANFPLEFLTTEFGAPKPWHGAPVPLFRRAFLALGNPRAIETQSALLAKLSQLSGLYFCAEVQNSMPSLGSASPNDDSSSSPADPSLTVNSPLPPTRRLRLSAPKKKGPADKSPDPPAKRRRLSSPKKKGLELSGKLRPSTPVEESVCSLQTYASSFDDATEWILGPSFSTEQIVSRYSWLYM